MNKKLGYQILELCGILLGNAILAFGIAAFVLPHGMITGGATGLGLVTSRVFGVDLSVAVAVYNIILFAVGAFVLGKKFALTTIVSTIVYPMFLSFFTQQQWIATMTNDILLSMLCQLSPGSIGISPLSTPHAHPFQRMWLRSSIVFYDNFNLDMDRSPGFGSAYTDLTPC